MAENEQDGRDAGGGQDFPGGEGRGGFGIGGGFLGCGLQGFFQEDLGGEGAG